MEKQNKLRLARYAQSDLLSPRDTRKQPINIDGKTSKDGETAFLEAEETLADVSNDYRAVEELLSRAYQQKAILDRALELLRKVSGPSKVADPYGNVTELARKTINQAMDRTRKYREENDLGALMPYEIQDEAIKQLDEHNYWARRRIQGLKKHGKALKNFDVVNPFEL